MFSDNFDWLDFLGLRFLDYLIQDLYRWIIDFQGVLFVVILIDGGLVDEDKGNFLFMSCFYLRDVLLRYQVMNLLDFYCYYID